MLEVLMSVQPLWNKADGKRTAARQQAQTELPGSQIFARASPDDVPFAAR